MLWEKVMDDSQYEATHYYYLEIRGDSSPTKNYFYVVNEISLPFSILEKQSAETVLKRISSYIYSLCLFLLTLYRKTQTRNIKLIRRYNKALVITNTFFFFFPRELH